MAKQTDIRPKITLACVECKERNYITRKNRRNDPDRLELKKYCPATAGTLCTARPDRYPTRSLADARDPAGAPNRRQPCALTPGPPGYRPSRTAGNRRPQAVVRRS